MIKIAIIGAGLAGLTTAHRLSEEGMEVAVYEARQRVGGRVFTVEMKNSYGKTSYVELGGQNITDGGEASNIRQLAKELALIIEEKPLRLEGAVFSQGKYHEFSSLPLREHCDPKKIDELAQKASNMGELIEMLCSQSRPLMEYLLDRMSAYEGVDVYDQPVSHTKELLQCMLSGGVASAHEAYEHKENEVVTAFFKDGNAALPEALAKALSGKVHLGKVLKKIETLDGSVRIEFSDGQKSEYDAVVLAVPVSTYKNIDLTNSGISSDMLSTIGAIGFGQNSKVATAFEGDNLKEKRYIVAENAISIYSNDQAIALLYLSKPLEGSKIQEASKTCSKGLSFEFDLNKTPAIQAVDENYRYYEQPVTHCWPNDPFALGSYSGYNIATADSLDQIELYNGIEHKALFMPVADRLFFAGEHATVFDCVGTMEGAVESGERTARAIIKEYALNFQ